MECETDNQQVRAAEIGWLAGFFDGEGYIGLRVERHKRSGGRDVYIRPEMSIVNTDKSMIVKAADISARLGVNLYVSKRSMKNRKKKWCWRVQTRGQAKIVKLFSFLLPHLTGEKQERTQIVVDFCISRIAQPVIDKHKELNLLGIAGNGGWKPYTRKQMRLFEKVQPMMRRGPTTSQTIREMQNRISQMTNGLKAARDKVEANIGMTIEEYLEL